MRKKSETKSKMPATEEGDKLNLSRIYGIVFMQDMMFSCFKSLIFKE